MTVLASLQTGIVQFTLSSLFAEVDRWPDTAKSLFELELEAILATRTPPSELEPV